MLHAGAFPSIPGSWLRQASPLWALRGGGNTTTPLTEFRVSITAATEADGASLLAQWELRAQTSSSKQTWPTIPCAQHFSEVTKTTPNESSGIQMSPADTWLWNRQSYTQLFLMGNSIKLLRNYPFCWFCLLFVRLLHLKPGISIVCPQTIPSPPVPIPNGLWDCTHL